MSTHAKELFDQALGLSASERALLAGWLIETLDDPVDDDVAPAWSEEIARRLTELDSGTVETVAWPEARRRILESPDGTTSS